MKRLKGFTIFEMLVVMVVSSIAVTLSIMIWLSLQKTFQRISHETNKRTEILLLKDQMREDRKDAAFIIEEADGFRLSSINKELSYSIFDEYIIRKTESVSDTFDISISRVEFKPVFPESRLLKEVALEMQGEGMSLPYRFIIDYDSKTLLKYTK